MAEYYVSPYRLSVAPRWRPNEERRMGKLHTDLELSAADTIANTWYALSLESSPRVKSDDPNRRIDVQRVERTKNQVICHCSIGISGYQSHVELENMEVPARRNFSDAEWFNLRIFFATKPGSRAGILVVERVGTFGLYGHMLGLLKSAFKSNFPEGLSLRLDPVQDITTLGFTLEELMTQAIEFRSVVKTADVAQNQGGGETTRPLAKNTKRALRKVTKFSRTGGLGSFDRFKGRAVEDLATEFGYVPGNAPTEAVATVKTPAGKDRKLSVSDGSTTAVSFPVERESSEHSPSQVEFLSTVAEVINGTGDALGISGLQVDPLEAFQEVEHFENVDGKWVIEDETVTR